MKQLSALIMVPDSASRARSITVLLQAGISTKGCSTPLELFGLLNEEHYDLVVLDVGELGELGFALIARLRGAADLGIVVKGDAMPVEVRLRCLQSGADAALCAPLDDRELACVLLALARRLPAWQDHLDVEAPTALPASGKWELRDQDWTLAAPSGATLSLSANERLLVRTLLKAEGKAVSRGTLSADLGADGGGRQSDVGRSQHRRRNKPAAAQSGTGGPYPAYPDGLRQRLLVCASLTEDPRIDGQRRRFAHFLRTAFDSTG